MRVYRPLVLSLKVPWCLLAAVLAQIDDKEALVPILTANELRAVTAIEASGTLPATEVIKRQLRLAAQASADFPSTLVELASAPSDIKSSVALSCPQITAQMSGEIP